MIRELYAKLPMRKSAASLHGNSALNVPGGRCEKCEGNGRCRIEMHFLPDVWVECDACQGRRYTEETLAVRYQGKSIHDLLEMKIGQARDLLCNQPKIHRILSTLCDVGLEYLALGQSAPTLSGGEAQRVKLAAEISRPDTGRTLYLLDEPTTGLHFDDVAKLLGVLHRLVDLANTVVVIEHNLDVIKQCDWVVEMGPEAGWKGGQLVFGGTPEQLVEYAKMSRPAPPKSRTAKNRSTIIESGKLRCHTGEALERILKAALRGTIPRSRLNDPPAGWENRIVDSIVSRVMQSGLLGQIERNANSLVEIRSIQKSSGWFLQATFGTARKLALRFRVPKGHFSESQLHRIFIASAHSRIDDSHRLSPSHVMS